MAKNYKNYQNSKSLQEKAKGLAFTIEDYISRVKTNGHVDKVIDFDLLNRTINHLNSVAKLQIN